MIWKETDAQLALDRQRALLAEAEALRLARRAAPTPGYREWIAHRLLVLALHIAPSLRTSVPGFADWVETVRYRPSANGHSLALLI